MCSALRPCKRTERPHHCYGMTTGQKQAGPERPPDFGTDVPHGNDVSRPIRSSARTRAGPPPISAGYLAFPRPPDDGWWHLRLIPLPLRQIGGCMAECDAGTRASTRAPTQFRLSSVPC